jgi:guanosine-3',5'-bis(diphosphate) 3'-pyrophosphohydrolase
MKQLIAAIAFVADKICNLRDIAAFRPPAWSAARKQEYFDWARAVVDGLRGAHPGLEHFFDQAYAARP